MYIYKYTNIQIYKNTKIQKEKIMKKYIIFTVTGDPWNTLVVLINVNRDEETEIKERVEKQNNFKTISDLVAKNLSGEGLAKARPILSELLLASSLIKSNASFNQKISVLFLAWEQGLEQSVVTGMKQQFAKLGYPADKG